MPINSENNRRIIAANKREWNIENNNEKIIIKLNIKVKINENAII